MTIVELIDAMQSAESPSTNFDAEIWMSINPKWRGYDRCDTEDFAKWVHPIDGICFCPVYTASIDAAASIAEKALPGVLIRTLQNDDNIVCKATICWMPNGLGEEPNIETEAYHLHEPIALCLAVLKALEKVNEEHR